MRQPINAAAIRKVANTLHDSVYGQLVWAINHLGVAHLWETKQNPLRLIYKPRGNRILFRGADNPEKMKSLITPDFPVAIMWVEELAEFLTEEEIGVMENSIMRATLPDGLNYKFFYSYNPPKRKSSWVNKSFNSVIQAPNTYIHHSNYLGNPFVSDEFRTEAEQVRAKSEHKYRWIYLGEPVGSGIVPFENLVFRHIEDNEFLRFDNFKQGIDWGYGADPYAFVRWNYDKAREILYAVDEHYGTKIKNRAAANWIMDNNYHYAWSIADSAEPKSIDDLADYGIRVIKAKKGPGSVEHGEKWLDERAAIVIDPLRTPNIAREFEGADYDVDMHGNLRNRLRDEDNHTIDSTRYALEEDMGFVSVVGTGPIRR